jgi:hypothetical protein
MNELPEHGAGDILYLSAASNDTQRMAGHRSVQRFCLVSGHPNSDVALFIGTKITGMALGWIGPAFGPVVGAVTRCRPAIAQASWPASHLSLVTAGSDKNPPAFAQSNKPEQFSDIGPVQRHLAPGGPSPKEAHKLRYRV